MKNAFADKALWSVIALVAAACGGSDVSPFATSDAATQPPSGSDSGGAGVDGGGIVPGGGPDGGAPGAPDAGAASEAGAGMGGIACGTQPARYIVLGHSVAACYQVGGPTSETCSLKNVETYLATKFPGLAYENYAVNGALIADVVNTQLAKVAGGPGNVFVNLYIGGNDLAAHLYEPDATAEQSWQNLQPAATQNLNAILAYFEDATRFPGKATILVNSQYNPFDECVTLTNPYATSVKQGIVKQFNDLLVTIVAGHKTSVVVDQYGAVLGHGDNYDQATSNGQPPMACPHYASGAASWMADLIHPNTLGHVALTKAMTATVDSIFACP
jgi:hypothetical protein